MPPKPTQPLAPFDRRTRSSSTEAPSGQPSGVGTDPSKEQFTPIEEGEEDDSQGDGADGGLMALFREEEKRARDLAALLQARKEAAIRDRIAGLEALRRDNDLLAKQLQESAFDPESIRATEQARETRRASQRATLAAAEELLDSASPFPEGVRKRSLGHVKISRLPPFKAETLREVENFIDQAERSFRLDAGYTLPDTATRIDFCVTSFERKPLEAWKRHEEGAGIGRTSWDGFKEVLQDMVISRENRPFAAAIQYARARPRPEETVADFANYLDTLEKQLSITGDVARKNLLFGKLGEELQTRIMNYNQLPGTRAELVAISDRLGQLDNITKKKAPSKGPGRLPERPRPDGVAVEVVGTTTSAGLSRQPTTGVNTIPVPYRRWKCGGCQTDDHGYAYCPKVTCRSCQGKGHMSFSCPEAGKGPA